MMFRLLFTTQNITNSVRFCLCVNTLKFILLIHRNGFNSVIHSCRLIGFDGMRMLLYLLLTMLFLFYLLLLLLFVLLLITFHIFVAAVMIAYVTFCDILLQRHKIFVPHLQIIKYRSLTFIGAYYVFCITHFLYLTFTIYFIAFMVFAFLCR